MSHREPGVWPALQRATGAPAMAAEKNRKGATVSFCHRFLVAAVVVLGLIRFAAGQEAFVSPRYGAKEGGVHSPLSIEGFSAFAPVMRKWYVPQELSIYYNWGGWEYTNYAREQYERYVDYTLEGSNYYDLFANYVTRGWKVYEWSQDQPQAYGSLVFKDKRYSEWFNKVLIASDSKGQYYFRGIVGDEIRTTLTPLTFSKPGFNGMQWDFMSDKYALTAIASRISNPSLGGDIRTVGAQGRATNITNLIGGRGTAQIGDFLRAGATYVNTHTGDSRLEWGDNPMTGNLGSGQNRGNVREITIRLLDDSPEDGEGGAILYHQEIIIDGRVRPDVQPVIAGGVEAKGFLSADGSEAITLKYVIPNPEEVKKIAFSLVLSDDYRVDVTSNLQTNYKGQPVFLTIARENGNIRDNSNQKVLRFDYGLPTGNDIYGFTLDIDDLKGFSVRAESNVNRQFNRFPNINLKKGHRLTTETARAFYVNVAKTAYPWHGFGEAFRVDEDYSTSVFLVDVNGDIDYENDRQSRFEYVDDNDDQDRFPDWTRVYQSPNADLIVFPGYDENNDLISDFNQNGNLIPDYEEPFLRYKTDPPEFLFGMDMNNNTVVDRFENDNAPDYPYKKGREGYNLYGGAEAVRNVLLTIGNLRELEIASGRHNWTTYGLLTAEKDYARIGRFQLFSCIRRVRDNIADNLLQWVQEPNTGGGLEVFSDPMISQDAIVSTSFLGFDYVRVPKLDIINKVKYECYHQRNSDIGDTQFLGIINKLGYQFEAGEGLTIIPRFKSQYRRWTRQPGREASNVNEYSEILSLLVRYPVLSRSWVQGGVEYSFFENNNPLRDRANPPADYVDDHTTSVLALQLSNRTDYLGYKLTTNAGFSVQRNRYATLKELNSTGSNVFISMFVGANY